MSEMRLELDLDAEDLMTTHTVVYLLWCNTQVFGPYADATTANQASADFRAAHPGDWFEHARGHWCELQFGEIWRLAIEPRAVLAALPTVPVDVAPRDTEEASR